jgi:hypothetical protein
MSPEMRSDILRFGRLLFLDAKKTQYNNVGWPYISPTVKDDEMKVHVVGESILTAESHSAYEWVLYSITQMEPRFKLCTIKYIFADSSSHLKGRFFGVWSNSVVRGTGFLQFGLTIRHF